MIITDVIFDSINLNDELVSDVIWHNFNEYPSQDSHIARLAMANKSIMTSRYFSQKTADVRFQLQDCTRFELETRLGKLKQRLQYRTGDIVVVQGQPSLDSNSDSSSATISDEVTYKDATVDSLKIVDMKNGIAIVEVTFLLLDPIGYGETDTLFSATGVTDAERAFNLSIIDIQGTFYRQYPVYTITVNSVTNGSTPAFEITNGSATLTYSGSLSADDVIVIDTENLLVTVNGDEVNFDGVFPIIDRDVEEITITSLHSARNYDVDIVNTARYI